MNEFQVVGSLRACRWSTRMSSNNYSFVSRWVSFAWFWYTRRFIVLSLAFTLSRSVPQSMDLVNCSAKRASKSCCGRETGIDNELGSCDHIYASLVECNSKGINNEEVPVNVEPATIAPTSIKRWAMFNTYKERRKIVRANENCDLSYYVNLLVKYIKNRIEALLSYDVRHKRSWSFSPSSNEDPRKKTASSWSTNPKILARQSSPVLSHKMSGEVDEEGLSGEATRSPYKLSYDADFQCPRCERRMEEPRLLPCLHPICLSCVYELMNRRE